jgi:glucose uptake protein GlcU
MRSMVVNGLLYLLFSLVAVFVFSDIIYFAIEIILGIIQTFLLITSVFMVIYRKDDKGLQDLLAKTRVVDDNEVK